MIIYIGRFSIIHREGRVHTILEDGKEVSVTERLHYLINNYQEIEYKMAAKGLIDLFHQWYHSDSAVTLYRMYLGYYLEVSFGTPTGDAAQKAFKDAELVGAGGRYLSATYEDRLILFETGKLYKLEE